MKNKLAKSIVALAAGVAAVSFAAPARADHFERARIDIRRGDDRHETRRVWVEPVYEERGTQVWVEPVYRTESVPVFVKGYWDTRCERVWVEPIYEVREVVRYERGRRVACRERVCVREGGWRNVDRKVWVEPHYRHEDRQVLVCAGHYETRRERVCVREGHWRTVEVERSYPQRDRFSINFEFGRR